MVGINEVFSRLDRWRGLPDYQLERRADLYFSLYLKDVLESALGCAVMAEVVPEFPIKQARSNRSDKVDYLAASVDKKSLIFVELKTDCRSTRRGQFEYLCSGAKKGGAELLADLRAIHKVSKARDKYEALIDAAAVLGLTEEGAPKIVPGHAVVLIVPHIDFRYRDEAESMFAEEGVPFHVVTFADVEVAVQKHRDPLSVRFAKSLAAWRSDDCAKVQQRNSDFVLDRQK